MTTNGNGEQRPDAVLDWHNCHGEAPSSPPRKDHLSYTSLQVTSTTPYRSNILHFVAQKVFCRKRCERDDNVRPAIILLHADKIW